MLSSIVLLQRDHEASPHLRALLEGSGRFEVVGMAHTVAEARKLLPHARPEILMTDLRLQDGDVDGLLRDLRRAGERRRLHVMVTLVSHDDALILDALRAGADGYWVHARSPELLLTTLEQLTRGESPMTPTIARHVLAHFQHSLPADLRSADDPLNPLALTDTEREILERVAQGYLIDEIAQQWQASVHTVARGIRRVYQKLQFDLRANGLSLA
jgi:DNA-binding NarL/FixJ family response regulator